MPRRPQPQQSTHVMRKLGVAFNPDTVCEYTGLALHVHPVRAGDGWQMGFWRVDGHLLAVVPVTPDEFAWLVANPDAYNTEHAQFMKWRDSLQPR